MGCHPTSASGPGPVEIKTASKVCLRAVRDPVETAVLLDCGGLILNGRFVSRTGGSTNYLLGLVTVVVSLRG